ncbi:hypothetical protein SAMN02745121_06535 [Nannocystis exedens]|uniref:Uncharacterized protein n=1 Tax=Nannocystis exedens TaxID=54 RepID=A0A1I2F8I1_9BACT|nr:hypothetical protein [Nannocystis exedens]PCC73003.1 hypothetical protein NAEX_06089 [Nannocystis exedens]SFF01642.1 hypothetical protein SAMN02745121_06535 [Nannocystis exedens]
MVRFQTPSEAAAYLAPILDRPVAPFETEIAPGIVLQTAALPLSGGAFVNSYTVTWRPPARAALCFSDPPISALDFARRSESVVTTTGGFFFLADHCRHRPRTLSLNLAIQRSQVSSLPVSDQDALVNRDGALSVVEVAAHGVLTLGRRPFRWAGSRTQHDADCYAYGNANSIILHQPDARTGKARIFQESSRFTPEITCSRWSDIGFMSRPDGHFAAVSRQDRGQLDIFRHDLVLRCPRTLAMEGAHLEVHTIGPLSLSRSIQAAISVGPSLSYPDLSRHPLNHDRSLGSFPLLAERPATRLVFYQTVDGARHLCLLDGRPGSDTFPGATLAETIALVNSRGQLTAGCFLDSGHTSKIIARRKGAFSTYGNRHYLQWPSEADSSFLWMPDRGRPTASFIALHPGES